MKKQDELMRELSDMIKETKAGKLRWKVECQTTEYNPAEEKPMVEEEGVNWAVDECYVSYFCEFRGKEFLMISYEMIHSAGEKKKTTNLVFLPPLGIRVFDIHALLPYAVEASQMLTYDVHMLWLTILEEYRKNPDNIKLLADGRKLTID